MEYLVKRSFRKTIAIYVLKDGTIEVRAPKGAPIEFIDGFVASKKDWISKALDRVNEQNKRCEEYDASYVYFLGKEYKVIHSDVKKAYFDGKVFRAPKALTKDETMNALKVLFKSQAKEIYVDRANVLSKLMGIEYDSLKISSAEKRWGSCRNKNINISWKLIMGEGELIDYVIIHELAHILRPDHSDEFWKIVKIYVPNYLEVKEKLKELQDAIETQGWNNIK